MPMVGRPPLVGLYDYSPNGTASGGFLASAPASNIIIPRPQETAIAGGGAVSCEVDFGTTADIGIIHIQNLVADPGATVTVNCGGYGESKTVGPSDAFGPYSPQLIERLGRQRFFIPPAPVSAGSVQINVSGSGIPVQIGYVGALSVWEAPFGMAFDWSIGVKDLSTMDRITFGSPYVTRKQGLRVLNMAFAFLRQGGIYDGNVPDQVFAANGGPFDAAVLAGRSWPTAGVPFPDDADNLERLSVGGFITADQAFTNPFFATWDTTFQIEQM
jgi:hypothetical protein